MSYTLIYEKRVVKADILKLGPNRERVRAAIESKLSSRPDLFGHPLQGELKGYRKLRVGPYRVIFRIEGLVVKIDLIEKRSIVYKEAVKRLIKRKRGSD